MGNKKKKAFVAVLCAMAVGAGLAACGNDEVTNVFVTYDGASISLTGVAGEVIALPTVERDGYAFDGWYTSADFSGSPVTEATYAEGVTYYAKWSPVYEVVFDLDGGSFTSSTALPLKLREGENVYENVQSYVPTNGDLQFGGWFIGDAELPTTYTMSSYGVTLTAKYKAEYVVNAYLQNEDLDGYTLTANYLTGYEYVDEEFEVPTITGYALADSDSDLLPLTISDNNAQNVFNLHYDRKSYSVVYNANYPNGDEGDMRIETHRHGVAFSLPTDGYEYDGYRFLGWATSVNAAADSIIRESEYSVTSNTVLYAIWNRGYVDMFGGDDHIYVSPFGDGKATLCRGGIDINGTYDERRDLYRFEGEGDFELRAKIVQSSGTFVYYSDRQGSSYYLYTNGAIDEHYSLSLDRTNEVRYYSTENGNRFDKTGTYTINDMGIYVAEFSDGTTFEFLTGTANDGSNRAIFRIRGDEYEYGAMGMLGLYYPVIVPDGFGNVMYISSDTARESFYTYTVSGGEEKTIITITTPASSLTVRIFDYDGVSGYELYRAALDHAFTDGSKTLTLDGCSNAVYADGNATVSGKFIYEQSVFGGYIVTLINEDDRFIFRAYQSGETTYGLQALHNDYKEYRYLDPKGTLVNEPYLVVTGSNTASLYEQHENALELVSNGTFVKQGDSYLYTATGDIADWSENGYTSLVVNLDTQSSSYDVYYRLSATNGEGSTDYTTTYADANGGNATLTTASSFAFYTDGNGNTVSGALTDQTTYVILQSGSASYYFKLDKNGNTFERLTRAPIVLTHRNPAGISNTNTTLAITGKALPNNRYEAIYSVKSGNNSVLKPGSYTSVNAAGLGIDTGVCTFVSDDGELTFKFLMMSSNNKNYFVYYEADAVVEIMSYVEADENGDEVQGSKITLTDRTTSGDVNIVVYNHDDTSIDGTCSSRELIVFNRYRVLVYTFTSNNGATTFEFTLVNGYFRRCAAEESFTAADGSTLTLDGRAHVAQYVDSDGRKVENGYVLVDNVLDSNDRAVMLLKDSETLLYFDVNTTARTFALRGEEWARYTILDNNNPTGEVVTLDGHGHASLTVGNGDPQTGTYTESDGMYTVAVGSNTYEGRLGTTTVSNTVYNVFLLKQTGITGSYLNKADLSVLVLDDVGGVTKYNSRGVADSGTYVRVDDNIFYYINDAMTEAAMYTVTSNGEVVGANYSATYYADDFSSIVFYRSGSLVINNNDVMYYRYDAATAKIYTYTQSASNAANKYGFVIAEFEITNDAITYESKTYTRFDGLYKKFTDADGNELEFLPTGAATFTVDATITAQGSTNHVGGYQVSVGYDDNGDVFVLLANVENRSIAGSYDKYKVIVSAYLDVSYNNLTYAVDRSDIEYGVMAYDYQYMVVLATYDLNSVYGQLYAQMYFGQMYIIGTLQSNGSVEYTLSGQINAIAPVGRLSVTFTDGKLSAAGYRNNNYGNMFTVEFVGDDDNTYHMNFFLLQSGIDGMCTYIVYSCTRVSDSVTLEDGSVIYSERFVYTSGFEIPKEDGSYYKTGDEYLPSLKYKGEIVCVVDYEDLGNNTWRFMSRVFAVDRYADYYYYYTYNVNSDDTIEPISVVRRFGYTVSAGEENTVRVITESATSVDGIYDILYVSYNGQTIAVKSCEKNGNTFTVTAEDDSVYTIEFTATEENETTTITATITPEN